METAELTRIDRTIEIKAPPERVWAVVDRLAGDDNKIHPTILPLAGNVDAVKFLDRSPLRFRERHLIQAEVPFATSSSLLLSYGGSF